MTRLGALGPSILLSLIGLILCLCPGPYRERRKSQAGRGRQVWWRGRRPRVSLPPPPPPPLPRPRPGTFRDRAVSLTAACHHSLSPVSWTLPCISSHSLDFRYRLLFAVSCSIPSEILPFIDHSHLGFESWSWKSVLSWNWKLSGCAGEAGGAGVE